MPIRFVSRAAALILAITLVAGCRGQLLHTPGNVQVTLALDENGVEVLDAVSVGDLPNPPVTSDALRFTFRPTDGSGVVSGAIPDSRILRSEFDRAGLPDPRLVISNVGVFDVRIPDAAGQLEITTPAGDVLGRVEVDPDAPKTRQMALMNQDDILAGPTKIVDHGNSAKKVDLLFLPEGYSEDEMENFHAHVQSIVEQIQTHSGYRDHWDGFNVWRQDVRSRESGTGSGGRPIDTAFDTAYGVSGVDRCVFFTNPAGIAAAKRLGEGVGADATIVLVNSTTSGGCARDGLVVSARPRSVADTVSHELGHALFGLADEYETPRGNGHCSIGPNVAIGHDHAHLPWSDMVNTSELPTPPSAGFATIGAFEGGGYCARGRYRPTHNCMMRSLGRGMCPVCKREVQRTMAALAPSEDDEGVVSVTNETGAPVWVRCDGNARPTCSDWHFVEDGESRDIRTPDAKLVVHNIDIEAPVRFDRIRVTAPSEDVTLYANATNPFTEPSDDGDDADTWEVPANLSPNGAVMSEPEVALTWAGSASADTSYRVVVEALKSGVWQMHDDRTTTEPHLDLVLGAENATYRWRVTRCSDGQCVSSDYAEFTTDFPVVDEPEVDETLPVPATPAELAPAHESSVSGETATFSWSADAHAQTFNIALLRMDAELNEWVSEGDVYDLTEPKLERALSVADAWYAWSVQACNASGCSEWTEYALLMRKP